jgi:hypothetical protein
MSFIQIPPCLVTHCFLVFLKDFMLFFFLLHLVLTWNDKIRCDLVFWAGLNDLAFKFLSTLLIVNTLEMVGVVTVGEILKQHSLGLAFV